MKRLLLPAILALVCLLLPAESQAIARSTPLPELARSVQSDSLQVPDHVLVVVVIPDGCYGFICRNDPVNKFDPLGLIIWVFSRADNVKDHKEVQTKKEEYKAILEKFTKEVKDRLTGKYKDWTVKYRWEWQWSHKDMSGPPLNEKPFFFHLGREKIVDCSSLGNDLVGDFNQLRQNVAESHDFPYDTTLYQTHTTRTTESGKVISSRIYFKSGELDAVFVDAQFREAFDKFYQQGQMVFASCYTDLLSHWMVGVSIDMPKASDIPKFFDEDPKTKTVTIKWTPARVRLVYEYDPTL